MFNSFNVNIHFYQLTNIFGQRYIYAQIIIENISSKIGYCCGNQKF